MITDFTKTKKVERNAQPFFINISIKAQLLQNLWL